MTSLHVPRALSGHSGMLRVRTCGCGQDQDEMAAVGSSYPFRDVLGEHPGSPCPISPFKCNVPFALGAWEEGGVIPVKRRGERLDCLYLPGHHCP